MNHARTTILSTVRLGLLASAALALAACSSQIRSGFVPDDGGAGGRDLASAGPDLLELDLAPPPLNSCGDTDPSCRGAGFGPPGSPFPLSSDPQPDPNQGDTGVSRDNDGYLVLGATHASFDFIYTANTDDWSSGTVSKINSKAVKEVARYFSVTCFGNPGDGSRAKCDGTKGCCTRDDYYRFLARGGGQPLPGHQSVQLSNNYPSRTAVDFNGDVWVANRAFGGQSSVTKIANDLAECTDRNGTPGIQTSSDVNGDGTIDTDCNRNGVPDDVADVQNKPCVNGKAQEFYGWDDECVLFTTNTNVNGSVGRPLALGRGAMAFGAADAWAGSFNDGKFFRVDGNTGMTKAVGQVGGNPYGATIDQAGILWSPGGGGGPLCYLDTANPQNAGCARMPGPSFGYGIGMDRDQNVWVGGYPTPHAFRYTPDRSNAFGNLGKGFWTTFENVGTKTGANGCQGRGIAADSRTPNQYWVWMACHGAPYIVRLDGNTPLPKGADKNVDASAAPSVQVAGSAIAGAGVDVEQNIWAVASGGAFATRIKVDQMGNPTQPMLGGNAGAGCPIGNGDVCTTILNGVDQNITSYTYSDFSGFGLRNFTNPSGEWTYTQKGCPLGDTKWVRVEWDAVVPPNTTLTVRARSGNTAMPDPGWGQWTGTFQQSPGDFTGVLVPNNPAQYIQVKFNLSTSDKSSTPRLKSFKVWYECLNVPG